jgi:general secretion pathway protein J
MIMRQAGLTLIELLVAIALSAVLGVLIAALVNSWVLVRERLDTTQQPGVLEFCMALERSFDSLTLRQLYEQRLPLKQRWLDWQAEPARLQWVALTAWPAATGGSRLQRQRLVHEAGQQRLALYGSEDLYAAGQPSWTLRQWLAPVTQVRLSFRQGQRWLAYPSEVPAQPNLGVRIDFLYRGDAYVCTFALPDLRP